MKKLFIGCGILVLLVLAGAGYLAYQVYPHANEWKLQWEAALLRLQELDREFPFEPAAQLAAPLDAPRFAASLDLRATLADDFTQVKERFMKLGEAGPDGEALGPLDTLNEVFRGMAPLMGLFESRLAAQQMSWPEFAFHTRLLWACLLRVDAGVGPPELEPLRGAYDRLKTDYEERRKQPHGAELPTLDDLIGTFPLPLITEASALLARDLARVERGLVITYVDDMYMQPITSLEQLQRLQAAQGDLVRKAAEQQATGAAQDGRSATPGVTQPAGAPEPLGKVPDADLNPPPAEPESPGDK